MDVGYTSSELAFRSELRNWLQSAVAQIPAPPPEHDLVARRKYDTSWQRQLADAGYAGIEWPSEYGGQGATPVEQLIFQEELARANAPYIGVNFVGILHAGPTLIAEGADDQKQRHLPKILNGDEVWCQCFSEPNAGSDLASLRTKAVRDGDEYVVNGHKIWTSFGEVADFAELLVRTDPDAPKHRGISWLIADMRTPGIEIRPLRSLNGSVEFHEVFFDNVRIPVINRVGEENDGWRVAMVTFGFERGSAFVSEVVAMTRSASELARVAATLSRQGGTVWDDQVIRRELGMVVAELDALWALIRRNVSESTRTDAPPGVGGSVLKLAFSELSQRLADVNMQVVGRAGLARTEFAEIPAGKLVDQSLRSLALTVAAGTSQIQRNIIAERILGMPKEKAWT